MFACGCCRAAVCLCCWLQQAFYVWKQKPGERLTYFCTAIDLPSVCVLLAAASLLRVEAEAWGEAHCVAVLAAPAGGWAGLLAWQRPQG
jgi:hypothetical protein